MAHPDSISGRQTPCQPPGRSACGTPLLSPAGRGWSPRSCGSPRLAPASMQNPGPVGPYHGRESGSGFGPGRGKGAPTVPGGGVAAFCRSLGTAASGPARPRGPASPRELPPRASSSRCRQGRPAPWDQAQGVGSDSQETCTECAGRQPEGLPPRARRGSCPPPRLRQGSCPSLHPASQALRRGSQPAAPSRRQLTPCDLRAPSPSPRGPRRPPPPGRRCTGPGRGGGRRAETQGDEAAGWQSLLGLSRTLPAPQRS